MNRLSSISGIAGIFDVRPAADLLYLALHAIQHRGPDACGMAVNDQGTLCCLKGKGMLSEVLHDLSCENATAAIGQVCTGISDLQAVPPVMVRAHQGHFAIAFSGTVTNAPALRAEMEERGLIFQSESDGELLAHLIQAHPGHLYDKISAACARMEGSWTFLLMTKSTMYAMRSGDGIHPLFMARMENGYAFSSENTSFSILQASDVREIPAGTLIRIGKEETIERQIQPDRETPCSMEYVYYARPDSTLSQKNVHLQRVECGKALAHMEDVRADMVIGVPDTAISAAMGFASVLDIPYEIGLIKNRYIGSTFVTPSREQRERGLRERLNAIPAIVRDKKILLVDDSLARGTTARRLCQLLREAGAREVHLRIASPRMVGACPYGYSDLQADQMAAVQYTDEEMKELYGLDSIRFLDRDIYENIMQPACMKCFGKEGING